MERSISEQDKEMYRYAAIRCLSLAHLLQWALLLDDYTAAHIRYFSTCMLGDGLMWCGDCDFSYKTCAYKICFDCLDVTTTGGCAQVCPHLQALSSRICGIIQPVWRELERGDLGSATITLTHVAVRILNYLRFPPNDLTSTPADEMSSGEETKKKGGS